MSILDASYSHVYVGGAVFGHGQLSSTRSAVSEHMTERRGRRVAWVLRDEDANHHGMA